MTCKISVVTRIPCKYIANRTTCDIYIYLLYLSLREENMMHDFKLIMCT